jgi:hypothetical protein
MEEEEPPYCTGSVEKFNPDAFVRTWASSPFIPNAKLSFEDCIRKAFLLPEDDSYEYHALGTTTLNITQRAIRAKRAAGLHGWYKDDHGQVVSHILHTP